MIFQQTNSSNMDAILKLSIPLLRQEKWRIRTSIYHNRTTKTKAAARSNDLITYGFSRNVDYAGLLKLFQSEGLLLELRCSSVSENAVSRHHGHGHHTLSTKSIIIISSSIDTIRRVPEIMMQVYSYLPLCDRIYGLALVDRAFSKDKIRAGIVSATYGRGFNLKQALLELKRWALEEMLSDDDEVDEIPPVVDTLTSLLSLKSKSKPKQLQCQHQRQQYHMERILKISRMIEAANLTDSEVLLFTGSNLTNTIVSPSEREKWITSYVRGFFDEQQHQQQQCEWLTDITLVQAFLRRYFFDEKVNRLGQLIKDAGFQNDFESYMSCQDSSKNHVDDESGKWIWCLPELYPGCNLLLLDPDNSSIGGGWKEYRFVSCGLCEKLHEHNKSNKVSCHHEHQRYFCNDCYPAVMSLSPTSFSGPGDTTTTNMDTTFGNNIHQQWIEVTGPKVICANCRDISQQIKLLGGL